MDILILPFNIIQNCDLGRQHSMSPCGSIIDSSHPLSWKQRTPVMLELSKTNETRCCVESLDVMPNTGQYSINVLSFLL